MSNRGEKPAHQVTLSAFRIARYEVTQRQWEAVMGENPSGFKGCSDCPVEKVSWDDVQEFLKKLNTLTSKAYRLPTEAEWEHAARGGSNSLDAVAWPDDDSGNKTHPVDRKKANELGLYDMSGNIWEWCADRHGDYQRASRRRLARRSAGLPRCVPRRLLADEPRLLFGLPPGAFVLGSWSVRSCLLVSKKK